MKIALLPSLYAPHVGGVEELTARLAARLVAGGDEVEVWTVRHPHDLPATEELDGVCVRRFDLPLPRVAAPVPLGAPRALRALDRAAEAFGVELLHVVCFSANGIYASALAARRGVPLVVTLQGETVMDDGDVYDHSVSLRLGLRMGLRRADAVTAPSAFVLDDAERRFGLAAGRGIVVPNGVELGGDAVARPLALPFERFVLALGRVVPKKGFDLLLDAFALVAPHKPGLGLVVGGDGPARAELERRAGELGLVSRVAFPGRLSRAQVAWATANADVFVLPSRVEPFGIVVLEALRARLPVVVSSRGGASEVVRDGREGLVVDPFDPRALAAAIERLLDEGDLRERLAAAGRRRAEEFDWALIAERYRELYGSLT